MKEKKFICKLFSLRIFIDVHFGIDFSPKPGEKDARNAQQRDDVNYSAWD